MSAVALAGCAGLTLPAGLGSSLGLGSAVSPAGSLVVSVALSQRGVQSLFLGISTVSIAVQDASQTVTVSDGSGQILSGVASASFSGVQPGPATVSANVLDASGASLGSASVPVTIASGSMAASLEVGVASGSAGVTASPTGTPVPSATSSGAQTSGQNIFLNGNGNGTAACISCHQGNVLAGTTGAEISYAVLTQVQMAVYFGAKGLSPLTGSQIDALAAYLSTIPTK